MYQHRPSRLLFSLGLSLLVVAEGCTITEPLRTEPYERGIVVLEAGQAGKGNASVSFISTDRGSRKWDFYGYQ